MPRRSTTSRWRPSTRAARATASRALTLAELVHQGAIEYIPFPPPLVGKYQSFTQADLTALRAAGYQAPMMTVAQGVARYVESLISEARLLPVTWANVAGRPGLLRAPARDDEVSPTTQGGKSCNACSWRWRSRCSRNRLAVPAFAVVNINTASQDEFVALHKGLGPAKAQAIIDYRKANGPFKSVDDLKHVKGIGAKRLEKLRRRPHGRVRPPRSRPQARPRAMPRLPAPVAKGDIRPAADSGSK